MNAHKIQRAREAGSNGEKRRLSGGEAPLDSHTTRKPNTLADRQCYPLNEAVVCGNFMTAELTFAAAFARHVTTTSRLRCCAFARHITTASRLRCCAFARHIRSEEHTSELQ